MSALTRRNQLSVNEDTDAADCRSAHAVKQVACLVTTFMFLIDAAHSVGLLRGHMRGSAGTPSRTHRCISRYPRAESRPPPTRIEHLVRMLRSDPAAPGAAGNCHRAGSRGANRDHTGGGSSLPGLFRGGDYLTRDRHNIAVPADAAPRKCRALRHQQDLRRGNIAVASNIHTTYLATQVTAPTSQNQQPALMKFRARRGRVFAQGSRQVTMSARSVAKVDSFRTCEATAASTGPQYPPVIYGNFRPLCIKSISTFAA
jgi:hypothetical protein